MKKYIVLALSALTIGFASCSPSQSSNAQNTVTVSQAQPSDIDVQTADVPGFNVSEFANLLKVTKDPASIEQAINQPNNKINNLDLNGDGNIDYLKVVESANNTLTVIDETSATASQTIATLTVNPQSQTLQVAGNQAYCGANYHYSTHYSVGDYLFMSYLLSRHAFYVTPYHYGYYPGFYRPYRSFYGYGYSRPYYRQTYSRNVRTGVVTRSTSASPSRSYNSSSRSYSTPTQTRKSFSTPTSSQRSFQVRNTSTPVRSGGFGNSSRSSSSRSSFGSGSSSSRSSFGSGRSSFGSSRSSSSSRSSFGSSRSSFGGGGRRR